LGRYGSCAALGASFKLAPKRGGHVELQSTIGAPGSTLWRPGYAIRWSASYWFYSPLLASKPLGASVHSTFCCWWPARVRRQDGRATGLTRKRMLCRNMTLIRFWSRRGQRAISATILALAGGMSWRRPKDLAGTVASLVLVASLVVPAHIRRRSADCRLKVRRRAASRLFVALPACRRPTCALVSKLAA
jgi:hypothetical protein